jgi:soluble lytic murein transglycosylase-like protein
MDYSSPSSPYRQAAGLQWSGCLRRFLPPLSVVIMGVVFALILSQLEVEVAETAPLPEEAAALSSPQIAPLFTPEVFAWEEKILKWSNRYGLDPNLVATVMQIESCGYQGATSPAGAMGLFQVMPYHFREGENPYQPGLNAKRGLTYLRQALESGGNIRLALAGYNGGITGSARPKEEWPQETVRFVYWGLGIYRDAKAGKDHSPRLEEWLDSGGASLCQAARKSQSP